MKPTPGSFIGPPLFTALERELVRFAASAAGDSVFQGDLEFALATVADSASEHEPRYPSGMPSPTPRNVGMHSVLARRKFL